MIGTVKIRIHDEVNINVVGLQGDHLQYFVDKYNIFAANYFFNPKFKLGRWDGKISHFSKTGRTFFYLIPEILPDLVKFGYNIEIDDLRITDPIYPEPIDENIFSHILHPDTGEPIILRDYQIDAVNTLISDGYGTCLAATSAGKAQPLTSLILTPFGWTTMGSIQVGHLVMSQIGTPTKVVGVFPQGKKDIYKITFHDGSSALCCKEHLWQVKRPIRLSSAKTVTDVMSLQDIQQFLHQKQHNTKIPGYISIPLYDPINSEEIELPIDPYLIGVLVGDGCLSKGSVLFSTKDLELVDNITPLLPSFDVTIKKSDNYDYRITKNQPQNSCPPSKNKLTIALGELHLMGTMSNTKFIPNIYKQGSLSQKLQLLRGLLDTDGTVGKHGDISYTTVSETLAEDVKEIVMSIGGICIIKRRTPRYTYQGVLKKGKIAFELRIAYRHPSTLFSLPRKKSRCKDVYRGGRNELTKRVVDITYHSTELAQCIQVEDSNHLYITNDYIVTHNTYMCAALLTAYDPYDVRSITIVPDQTLIRQTFHDYVLCGLDTGEYSGKRKTLEHKHIVSTWQALQHNPMLMNGFNLVIIDEAHNLRGPVLKDIICEHAAKIPYRFGFTGTLPKEPIDALAVKLSVGAVKCEIPAHLLIERGVLATLDIECWQLEEDLTEQYAEYQEECKKHLDKPVEYKKFKETYFSEYSAEKAYLQYNHERLEWIADKLVEARDAKGNVLCLVTSIPVARKLTSLINGAIVVNGTDVKDPKKRQAIYDLFKTRDDLIVIATVHIAGTGLSINRIFTLFGVDLGKSFTRVIQAIGRGLRKSKDKQKITYVDISSDLKFGTLHLSNRIKYYKEALYPHKKHRIKYNNNIEL